VLPGRVVTLRPLHGPSHAEALYEGTHGAQKEDLWRYLPQGPFASRAAYDDWFGQKEKSVDPLFLAIVDNATGVALGQASYLRIEPAHRTIEVGHILFTPALQRSCGATEAMYLMARHAFADLGYRRYEWKCNASNEPSRRAALRLGFTFEGVFRQHMIVKGRNRDTAWFSMLDSEWPLRQANFEQWLAPSNFDAAGEQRLSLSRLNGL
jgi:RimJ/RimL family protein N-acetyltransferase